MRVRQIKNLLLTGLAFIGMTLPIAAADGQPQDSGQKQAVAEEQVTLESASLVLSYIPAEDRLTVRDKASGAVWHNIPPDAEEDTVAQGTIKKELQSSLIVSFVDTKNNSFTANSQTSSVGRSTNTAYRTDGGILVEYDFSRNKEEFMIPVLYKLNGSRFIAEILFNKIKEYGTNKICNIKLLPYFGAGKTGEDGIAADDPDVPESAFAVH